MKCNTVALVSLSLAFALAQPHKHHQHQAHHEKRDLVWVTEVEYVTETVDITTTIWVNADATSAPKVIQTSLPTTTSSSVFTSKTPAEFHESPTATPVPQDTSSSAAPTPPPPPPSSSVYVPPPPPPSPAYVAPPEAPNTPPYVPPSSSEAPPPVQSSPPAAPAAVSSPPSSGGGGGGGQCTSGSPCTGDLTFYEAGLGACGETTDGEKDNVIALPVGMMGAQSNGNPFCGKTVTITKGGKSVTAIVVDKCMGCKDFSIDLSNKAFKELGIDYDVGRTQGSWYFN